MPPETLPKSFDTSIKKKSLSNTSDSVAAILSETEHENLLKEINENIIGIKMEAMIFVTCDALQRKTHEILIKWKDDVNGEDFLKQIYDAGMSFEILKKVCKLTKTAISENEYQKISLNLHPRDFLNPELEEQLEQLFTSGLKSENLTLELLEEEVESNEFKPLILRLNQLKEKYGLNISMDDFDGTKEMLERYFLLKSGIDNIKIDKNYFWAACEDSENNENMKISELSYFIEQFHRDWKMVVIEGIQTNEHMEIAIAIGADLLQGHLFEKEK